MFPALVYVTIAIGKRHQSLFTIIKGVSSKETVVLRRWESRTG